MTHPDMDRRTVSDTNDVGSAIRVGRARRCRGFAQRVTQEVIARIRFNRHEIIPMSGFECCPVSLFVDKFGSPDEVTRLLGNHRRLPYVTRRTVYLKHFTHAPAAESFPPCLPPIVPATDSTSSTTCHCRP